jgi:hypothetical protein
MRQFLTFCGLIILAGIFGWSLAASGLIVADQSSVQAQTAETSRDDLYTLLKRLDTENQPWTLHFAVPLDTGARNHTMEGTGAVIGEDYFCYSEPWNSGSRYHCTPFSNIVSVTFED